MENLASHGIQLLVMESHGKFDVMSGRLVIADIKGRTK